MTDHESISEVPDPHPQQSPGTANNLLMDQITFLASGMEGIFKKISENMTACRPTQITPTKLIHFDPDEPEADIVNWCTLSEMIIEKKKLEGVDLILALTHSLKGRAATCLSKVRPDQINWTNIKEMLLSRFSKPMMMQDHFDQIIKFQIGSKEGPAEAGMRLWQLIEKIPDANMPEEVATGFAISILSQCDDKIRRELNSVIIKNKTQLFRTLRSFTIKRKNEDPVSSDTGAKRPRHGRRFRGNCHFCGRLGHRAYQCRDRLQLLSSSRTSTITPKLERSCPLASVSRAQITCYACGDNHKISTCPMRYKKKKDTAPSAMADPTSHVNA